jgi:hypothetical protein
MKAFDIPCEVCGATCEGNDKDGFRCSDTACPARIEYDASLARETFPPFCDNPDCPRYRETLDVTHDGGHNSCSFCGCSNVDYYSKCRETAPHVCASTTTTDGHGAYCATCGEVLA